MPVVLLFVLLDPVGGLGGRFSYTILQGHQILDFDPVFFFHRLDSKMVFNPTYKSGLFLSASQRGVRKYIGRKDFYM